MRWTIHTTSPTEQSNELLKCLYVPRIFTVHFIWVVKEFTTVEATEFWKLLETTLGTSSRIQEY